MDRRDRREILLNSPPNNLEARGDILESNPAAPFAKSFAPPPSAPMTGAEREIRRLIAERGAMPFRDFMRLALYHPDGYYSRRRRIGADGDYFTSPTLHPAFGALIAVQMREMWRALGHPSPFWIVEPGAGGGELARDVLAFCQTRLPDFARAVRYAAIDRSPPPSARVRSFGESWIKSDRLPLRGVVGCVVSNELLDAFPVHRFEIQNGEPREIHVDVSPDGGFVETLRPPSSDAIGERLRRLPFALPDGFRGEVNPEIGAWAASASAALERGFVISIDYGGEADEIYAPRRSRGTLQTHYRHVAGSSPYQRIGRQDMTARVDFTEIIERGASAGLRPVFLTSQAEFLTSLGVREMERAIRESPSADRAETRASVRALRQLTQPDGLGGFRVLVQDKNSSVKSSADIAPRAANRP